jgi:hypothetical protein
MIGGKPAAACSLPPLQPSSSASFQPVHRKIRRIAKAVDNFPSTAHEPILSCLHSAGDLPHMTSKVS